MSIDVELVVTDLDGTLWHLDHDLHHRTRDALAELERRGLPLLVATGRRLRTTAEPLRRFGLTPPAIVLNGSLGVDLATDERFHEASIPRDSAIGVLAGFRGAGLEPCVYVDGGPDDDEAEVYLAPAPSTHPGHVAALGSCVRTGDLDEVVATRPVLGFSLLGVPEVALSAAASHIGSHGIAHLDPSIEYPGLHSLTVTGPGMSKWEGVLSYCRRHGVDPTKVLALGDGINDVELLTGAAVAVVPEDANPVVRAIAHHTVGCAVDGGWAELLDLLD